MKYINPGLGELLDVDTGVTVESTTYNPTNGVALYQTTDDAGVALLEPITKLYGKFDIYLPPISEMPSSYFAKIGVYNNATNYGGFNGVAFDKTNAANMRMVAMARGSYVASANSASTPFKYNSINQVLFCFTGATSGGNGSCVVYLNGNKLLENTSCYSYLNNSTKLVIYSASEIVSLSNIILSDTEVTLKEQIIALPLKDITTDMTAGENGNYIADTIGQQFLSTVDATELINTYGDSSKVTGITMVAYPGYRTGEGMSSLIGISKSGDTITEHGSTTLKTSTTAGVIVSYGTDITLGEMAGMQLGWKVGE